MDTYEKPLPIFDHLNRPFWEAARAGHLCLQHCTDCGHVRYPINHVCTKCLSHRAEWKNVSGRGTIFSYIVFHKSYHPAFAKDLPYNVAMIQLDEGPRMISNIIADAGITPKVGDYVAVVFDPATPEISIPRFRLVTESA
jgi:uncharacterized OB-fold protein